jgi:hypothetical protein
MIIGLLISCHPKFKVYSEISNETAVDIEIKIHDNGEESIFVSKKTTSTKMFLYENDITVSNRFSDADSVTIFFCNNKKLVVIKDSIQTKNGMIGFESKDMYEKFYGSPNKESRRCIVYKSKIDNAFYELAF